MTRIDRREDRVEMRAPFACPGFTIKAKANQESVPKPSAEGRDFPMEEVTRPFQLKPGTWLRQGEHVTVCFDLPKGPSLVLV